MYPNRSGAFSFLSFLTCLLLCSSAAMGQGLMNNPNGTARDTSSNKSNTNAWDREEGKTFFKLLQSEVQYSPDTSLHTFHRRPFSQPWYRDLGNLGSPTRNLLFTPEQRTGPTLGYHVFDVYRFNIDSLRYYNTTRPYSNFTYQLGSKLEQLASIMHTQNISPRWNFAFEYHKTTSPGFYKIQRTNHDNGSLTTHYQGKHKHYELYGAMVYNKEQFDENGGIANMSLLDSSLYGDRKLINTKFENDGYSTKRSTVTNVMRDFALQLQHSYTVGKTDTLYNEDSTKATERLTPRFRITHKFSLGSEKHQYKDIAPDSLRYTGFFEQGFRAGLNTDSVQSTQKWFYVDNRLLLNGFLGKAEKQLSFSAGIGNRYDLFSTEFVSGKDKNGFVSNYLIGQIKKEALQQGEWFYGADAQFFFTGQAAGNLTFNAFVGKDLGKGWGTVDLGVGQVVNNAPYNYQVYRNQYDSVFTSFNKESVTQLYASFKSPKLKLSAGLRNYLIANYIYMDGLQHPAQYADPFNISQVWLRKAFTVWRLVLDNELVYQQKLGTAPVNIPAFMGRHQLSIETQLFQKALRINTGVEVRYHTTYAAAGYDPFFNRFYYQDVYKLNNLPEESVFFDFRIKRFRAYIMADQLQQLFTGNSIIASGYAAQNFMIRFGFTWIMIN